MSRTGFEIIKIAQSPTIRAEGILSTFNPKSDVEKITDKPLDKNTSAGELKTKPIVKPYMKNTPKASSPTTATVSRKADQSLLKTIASAPVENRTAQVASPAVNSNNSASSAIGGRLTSESNNLGQVLGYQAPTPPTPKSQAPQIQPYAEVDKVFAGAESLDGSKRTTVSATGTIIKVGAKFNNGADITLINNKRHNDIDTNGKKSATNINDNIVNIAAPVGDSKEKLTGSLNVRFRDTENVGSPNRTSSTRFRLGLSKKFSDNLTGTIHAANIFSSSGVQTQQYTVTGEYSHPLLSKTSPTKLNITGRGELRYQSSSVGSNGLSAAATLGLNLKTPIGSGNLLVKATVAIETGGQPDPAWDTNLVIGSGYSRQGTLFVGYEIK
jgi:hypothetical protein